jgi:hypothetical protein
MADFSGKQTAAYPLAKDKVNRRYAALPDVIRSGESPNSPHLGLDKGWPPAIRVRNSRERKEPSPQFSAQFERLHRRLSSGASNREASLFFAFMANQLSTAASRVGQGDEMANDVSKELAENAAKINEARKAVRVLSKLFNSSCRSRTLQ